MTFLSTQGTLMLRFDFLLHMTAKRLSIPITGYYMLTTICSYSVICCTLLSLISDNHDIIGMKFYELESNEKEDTEKDYTDIVPRAEHAAPYRGKETHVLKIKQPPSNMHSQWEAEILDTCLSSLSIQES